MLESIRRLRAGRPRRFTAAFLISLIWLAVIALAVRRLRHDDGIAVAIAGLGAAAITLALSGWSERARWRRPVGELARSTEELRHCGGETFAPQPEPELQALANEITVLMVTLRARTKARRHADRRRLARSAYDSDHAAFTPSEGSLTHSGLFDAPPLRAGQLAAANISGEHSVIDMVNRLDPKALRWLESSPAEQDFLGWTLDDLRQRSFLDIVHPNDRKRAKETFSQAIARGEALGLIVRIRTAGGKARAIEVNVGARYGTNQRITHLRCHLTDVTEKMQAERELKIRTRELTQTNEQLRRINRELEDLRDRYTKANEELSSKNRELDEFVYVVSHDLQEPLRSLTSFSGFLADEYADRLEAEGQEYVRYVVDASRRMRAMIQGLLKLSRAGKVLGEFAEVDLDLVLADVKADLAELLRTHGAEIRPASPLPKVWGDRDRIGQLLANLLTNGVKYNEHPSKWVEVAATCTTPDSDPSGALGSASAPSVTISIKDNGIGIEHQFHGTIFQLFRRLHPHEEYEGTGVGLAICNKIVQAHGGRIWVESEPGQGATFFVQLRGVPTTAPAPQMNASNTSDTPYENRVTQVPSDERHAV
jgi:PAS domain S-box-containing protein